MLYQYGDGGPWDDSFICFISLQEAVKLFQRDYWVLMIQGIKRHPLSNTDIVPQVQR